MRHSSENPPKSYEWLCEGHIIYDGDLAAEAVAVMVRMGMSESMNRALSNSVQQALKNPNIVSKVKDSVDFIYTTEPPQTSIIRGVTTIVVPYKIWFK